VLPAALLTHFCHGVGQPITIVQLGKHGRVGHHFVDAFDGVSVGIAGDEDDRYLAYLSKPP
jgi:hypothetical protein